MTTGSLPGSLTYNCNIIRSTPWLHNTTWIFATPAPRWAPQPEYMKLSYQKIQVANRRRSGDPGERPVVTHDLVNGRSRRQPEGWAPAKVSAGTSVAPSIKLTAYSLTWKFGVIGAQENILGGTIRISKQFLYHLKRFCGTKSPEHIKNWRTQCPCVFPESRWVCSVLWNLDIKESTWIIDGVAEVPAETRARRF